MTKPEATRMGQMRIAAAAFLLPFAAAPAAAGQARAVLSVSAVVAPSCRIDREEAAIRHEIACSAETRFSTATVAHRDERPLAEAAAILGAPARSVRGVEFAAPSRAPVRRGGRRSESATRYHTITY